VATQGFADKEESRKLSHPLEKSCVQFFGQERGYSCGFLLADEAESMNCKSEIRKERKNSPSA
jgi:hypothetical protein